MGLILNFLVGQLSKTTIMIESISPCKFNNYLWRRILLISGNLMNDRNFFLHFRDTNHCTNGGDNLFTYALGRRFYTLNSRQSLHTYWAISSIWDIASVAHFLTLSSSTFTASILFACWLNFLFVCCT